MRISRKKRPKKSLIPEFKINEKIIAPEVRLIDNEENHIGIVTISEARALAREKEMDLIIINPKAEPPVAQISDFAHFKYQKTKEARKQKIKSKASEMKGIRLSVRIGKHDLEIRRKQAEKFLNGGNKVKVEVILRGAEKSKGHLAYDIIQTFHDMLAETLSVKLEQEPKRQGHKVFAVISKS